MYWKKNFGISSYWTSLEMDKFRDPKSNGKGFAQRDKILGWHFDPVTLHQSRKSACTITRQDDEKDFRSYTHPYSKGRIPSATKFSTHVPYAPVVAARGTKFGMVTYTTTRRRISWVYAVPTMGWGTLESKFLKNI